MRSICLITTIAVFTLGQGVSASVFHPGTPAVAGRKNVLANQAGPRINQALVVGKQLIIIGFGFQLGATVLLDGNPTVTDNDPTNPTTMLIARKGGRKVVKRDWQVTLQVQNPDGVVSDEFTPVKLITVTLADNGKTITVNRQDAVFVFLGSDLQWKLMTTWDQSILSPVIGVMLIRGAQALLKAAAPGETTLSLTGDPPCRGNTPPCDLPSLSFSVTIVVQ